MIFNFHWFQRFSLKLSLALKLGVLKKQKNRFQAPGTKRSIPWLVIQVPLRDFFS